MIGCLSRALWCHVNLGVFGGGAFAPFPAYVYVAINTSVGRCGCVCFWGGEADVNIRPMGEKMAGTARPTGGTVGGDEGKGGEKQLSAKCRKVPRDGWWRWRVRGGSGIFLS